MTVDSLEKMFWWSENFFTNSDLKNTTALNLNWKLDAMLLRISYEHEKSYSRVQKERDLYLIWRQ